jgi:hypothetical protein
MGTMFIKTRRKTKTEMVEPSGRGLKEMKMRNRTERRCKDRGLWNEIVKQAKTHPGL